MAQDVADYLLDRLRRWEVEKVFGYAGDGIPARTFPDDSAVYQAAEGDDNHWGVLKERLETKTQELISHGSN